MKKKTSIIVIISLGAAICTLIACLILLGVKYSEKSGNVRLIRNGETDFIFVSANNDNYQMYYNVCRYASGVINDSLGVSIPVKTEKQAVQKYEIIVGPTNRGEYFTESEIASLGETGYLVKAEGSKIHVLAFSEPAGKAAMDHLINLYSDTKDNTLNVPKGTVLTSHITEEELNPPEANPRGEITYGPVVFAVGDEYQIIYHTNIDGMAWVEIDGVKYYDEYAGIIKSETSHHNVKVPMSVLDEAKSYDLSFAPVYSRPPYSPTSGVTISQTFVFRPIDLSDGLQLYTIADSHSVTDITSNAAKYFDDKLDLLVLCGDISNDSRSMQNMYDISTIAYNVTGGCIPVVYARGNHEARGEFGEFIGEHVGSDDGKLYFTFQVGGVWGIVLDCGEDKIDSNVEYGGMVSFTNYRLAQTKFLEDVIANAANEYDAEGIKYRIAVCHVPFSVKESNPAPEIFAQWRELCANLKLDIMLTGHHHVTQFYEIGKYTKAQNYAVAICASRKDGYTGTAVELIEDRGYLRFTDQDMTVKATHEWVLVR